jgi:hypothetical protein
MESDSSRKERQSYTTQGLLVRNLCSRGRFLEGSNANVEHHPSTGPDCGVTSFIWKPGDRDDGKKYVADPLLLPFSRLPRSVIAFAPAPRAEPRTVLLAALRNLVEPELPAWLTPYPKECD